MKQTKFMTRVFSAQENQEDLVLDQIENDIDMAIEDGHLETEEYNIDKLSDSQAEVYDKVNDETTIINIDGDEFSMKAKEFSEVKYVICNPAGKVIENEFESEESSKNQSSEDKLVMTLEEALEKGYRKPDKTFSDAKWMLCDPGSKLITRECDSFEEAHQEMIRTDGRYIAMTLEEALEKGYRNPDKSFSEIPDGLSNGLEDIAQMSHGIKYQDFLGKDWTPDEINKARGYVNTLKGQLRNNGKINEDSKTYRSLVELLRSLRRNKSFSEIKSEDEFREYAHRVMKEAHRDEYSEETTDKVVDDLIKNNPDADYGELIGRLTSGFGNKNMSDMNPTPNQEGADYELRQWVIDHPGQAKYIAELGAKWGTDNILEGLDHDMGETKNECDNFKNFSEKARKYFGK